MTTYKHLLWLVPAILIVAMAMLGGNTPIVSPHTIEISHPEQKNNQDVKQVEVRKLEKLNLKNQPVMAIETQKVEEPSLKNPDVKEIEIRKEEENRLKKQDKFYTQHTKALASRYEETAKLVASRGGDPRPLLDAADYFEKESK